jgi:glycosyltransferase involved in cell wall biosynthesis
MVIAHVLSSLRIGGQERVALELGSGQAAAGHEVIVVSLAPPPDGPLADAFRQRGVTVVRVAKRAGFDLTLPLRLAAAFRRRRVGVVHTHNRMPLIYGAAAGKLAGAVVVHTRHGPGRGTPREQWMRSAAGRLLDAYVAVSPELGELARSLGDCAPHKLTVIENGIDLDRFGGAAAERLAARAALGIPATGWAVGTVGRLAAEKDFPLLVRAAAPLLGDDARLVIVGDGAEAAAIRAEVAHRKVEPFVSLPGSRDDVPRLLAALDVFALSSRMEGLPLCALEAMAAGLPVVATAVGGLPGLIEDGVTGFLVPAGDEETLRRRLAALRADPVAARAMGARGQAHVRQKHSREAMVGRYLDLYARSGARACSPAPRWRSCCWRTPTSGTRR